MQAFPEKLFFKEVVVHQSYRSNPEYQTDQERNPSSFDDAFHFSPK
jgi:hypothetical protein